MNVAHQPKIVVLGMMSRMRVAGAVWQTLHYLMGLRRLGFEVFYVETHGCVSWAFLQDEVRAAEFVDGVMRGLDMGRNWAFHARHASGAFYGMSEPQVRELYREAAAIINLHGGTEPAAEHITSARLIYVETDPGWLQIQLHDGDERTAELLEPHSAFFTFGENYGRTECTLPVSPRFQFKATRQPLVLDLWKRDSLVESPKFTTVGNWRQTRRVVLYEGKEYQWSKHFEFLKFIGLPARTSQRFELALSSLEKSDQALLVAEGWEVRDAASFSLDLNSYRDYIASSRGEFTVAKEQNIRFRTGWFSDRSATYLAASRPVITQETGFSSILPVGEGLFAFSGEDEVLAAIEAVNGDYRKHSRAALAIAREFFSYDVVLPPMLKDVGVGIPSGAGRVASRPAKHRINLVGDFSSETGLGESARRYLAAMQMAGIAATPIDVNTLRASPQYQDGDQINLVCSDIARQPLTPSLLREKPLRDGFNIGLWLWELASIPQEWRDRFVYYDEIWAPTSFLAGAFAPLSTVPVIPVGHPLEPQTEGVRERGRQRLNIPPEEFVFTFLFNFFSRAERKNPLAVIDAFRSAFQGREAARLIIKSVNSDFNPACFVEMQHRADGHRITLHDGAWSRSEVADLIAACDCYVSLHRAEGVGLPIGDAMAAGKPVIATGWSGNTDFMSQFNSFPVRYRCVELPQNLGHYPKGSVWAEPDVDHAAELMRYVFDHREEALQRGECARADIAKHYSLRTVGESLARRLELIRQRGKFRTLQESLRSPIVDLHAFLERFSDLAAYVPEHQLRYEELKKEVHQAILSHVPPSKTVLILSGGDSEQIELRDRRGWHFPQDSDRNYAGYHPANSAEAIRNLELMREQGAEFLVFPSTSFWWLDHYQEFRDHLREHYPIAHAGSACLIFEISLREAELLQCASKGGL